MTRADREPTRRRAHDEPRYVLSAAARFQVRGADEVVASTPRRTTVLSFDGYQVILAFRSAQTIRGAYDALALGTSRAVFRGLVARWVELGLLSATTGQPPGPAFLDHANREVFGEPAVVAQIAAHLRANRLVHIPNAMSDELAGRVHAALDGSAAWRPYEAFHPFFHYKHHNLQVRSEYPDELEACLAVFGAHATRRFVNELSGRDCAGDPELTASRYYPGDYSLPHTDRSGARAVAFVWHLTKGWDPTWGGALVWCPTGTSILPRFNCLTLFNVTAHSLHFVAPVATLALGKRLTVNGWWCNAAVEAGPRIARAPRDATIDDAGYGPPRPRVAGRDDIVIL